MEDTISREKTIAAMEDVDWYHINKDGQLTHGANSKEDEPLYKAEDVYKVLNDMPTAQPEKRTDKCTETHACDLISRQDAIDYCYALINAENPSDPRDEWNYSQERINQTEVILHHLEVMPSAQPDIIRCKDCAHWKHSTVRPSYCEVWDWNNAATDYCSFAERRTDEVD